MEKHNDGSWSAPTDGPGPPAGDAAAGSDAALMASMRAGSEAAWREYDRRFRPLLEAFARRTGIPVADWPECIIEVLEDEALKIMTGERVPPRSLAAYLTRAVRSRYLMLARATKLRRARNRDATEMNAPEPVVPATSSEHALRVSAGADAEPTRTSPVLRRLAERLCDELTADELLILGWASYGVPHREIAAWIGASYDATTKRIWRIERRLRAAALRHARSFTAEERHELDRFFRRLDFGDASRDKP